MNHATYEQLFARALEAHQAGHLDAALDSYQALLAAGRRDLPLLVNCAAALRQRGRAVDAVKMLRRATELAPEACEIWFNLANAEHAAADPCGAERSYQRAIQLRSDFYPALFNLARLLAELNRVDDAAIYYRKATQADPNQAQAWTNRGNVERRRGRYSEALDCHRRAIGLAPHRADLRINLANALRDSGNRAAAERCYHEALQIDPTQRLAAAHLLAMHGAHDGDEQALQRAVDKISETPWSFVLAAEQAAAMGDDPLGWLERGVARFPDAACLRSARGREHVRRQRLDDAIPDLEQAVDLEPGDDKAWGALAVAHHQLGQHRSAHIAFERALAINSTDPETLANQGLACARERRHEEAIRILRRASARDAAAILPRQHLAMTLIDVGRSAEAEALARKLMELCDGAVEARRILAHALLQQGRIGAARETMAAALEEEHVANLDLSNAAFMTLYDDRIDARTRSALHRQLSARIAPAMSSSADDRSLRTDHRDSRLRIGYVSADLRDHPVGYLVEPVLAGHDRERFEIHVYCDVDAPDSITDRLLEMVEFWHDVRGHSDDQVLALIRGHNLDLLVDLGGHTSGNRMPVFASRAAPRQACWLGYPSTTGLANMDFLVADATLIPHQHEPLYSERIARLPTFAFGWARTVEAPPPRRDQRPEGRVTLACWNNIAKWSDRSIDLWSMILQAAPETQLSLRASALADPRNQTAVMERFAARGITADRLQLLGPLRPLRAYLDAFSSVDLLLDPVPYNGGATSLGALWQGVPLVTRPGQLFMGRMGASLLAHLGLEELIARTDDDYVAIAVALASDSGRLVQLRRRILDILATLKAADAAHFTRQVEELWASLINESEPR